MEINLKLRNTLAAAASAVLLSGILIWTVFSPAFSNLEKGIRAESGRLDEKRSLLANKKELTEEWAANEKYFQAAGETSGQWLKDLLNAAQSESLTVDRIEPAKSDEVFMSFQGDILKFTRFMHRLMQDDPLAEVLSFSARQEEGKDKNLSFEILLRRAAA